MFKANKPQKHKAIRLLLLAMLCLAGRSGPEAGARTAEAEAVRVKAGFIYNFAVFVSWPEQAFAGDSFRVCVTDLAAVGNAFESLEGKAPLGRRMVVTPHRPAAADNCQILFVNSADRQAILQALQSVQGQSVLTVGEAAGFGELGGIINIMKDGSKFRLEVNREAAKRANLKISSRVLNLKRTRFVKTRRLE